MRFPLKVEQNLKKFMSEGYISSEYDSENKMQPLTNVKKALFYFRKY